MIWSDCNWLKWRIAVYLWQVVGGGLVISDPSHQPKALVFDDLQMNLPSESIYKFADKVLL